MMHYFRLHILFIALGLRITNASEASAKEDNVQTDRSRNLLQEDRNVQMATMLALRMYVDETSLEQKNNSNQMNALLRRARLPWHPAPMPFKPWKKLRNQWHLVQEDGTILVRLPMEVTGNFDTYNDDQPSKLKYYNDKSQIQKLKYKRLGRHNEKGLDKYGDLELLAALKQRLDRGL